MKNKNKFVSLLLTASLTLGILPGCDIAKEVNTTIEPVESSIIDVPTLGPTEKPIQEPVSKPTEEPSKEINSLDEYYNYLANLPSKDINEVFDSIGEYENIDLAKAAYDNLIKNNIDINDENIQKELMNVIICSTYPMGISDNIYNDLVGTLASTLNENQNVFYCYYPLAIGGHLATCEENHTKNEFGKLECSNIIKNLPLQKSNAQLIEENFSNDEAFLRIKNAMENNNLDLNIYLNELENLALLSLSPTDMPDEIWQKLFGHLLATLNEGESLYEVYINLAINSHNLLNPSNKITLVDNPLVRM